MRACSGKLVYYTLALIVGASLQASKSDQGFVGEQRISEECSTHKWLKKHVYVNSVSLVCDSPDASGDEDGDDEDGEDAVYTDSLTCRQGDRAKVAVLFDIVRYSTKYDISLSISSSLFGKPQPIRNATNLCAFSNLAYWGGDIAADDLYANAITTPCPLKNGPYALFTSFTVPSYIKDEYFEITPDLHLEFHREGKSGDTGMIGCVETGTLASIGFSKTMERRGERFFVISILLVCLIFGFCLLGHRRRREQTEKQRKRQKMAMLRRFHYIRTTRSNTMDTDHPPTHGDHLGGNLNSEYRELS